MKLGNPSRSPGWRYYPASETQKPGYLKRRFAIIRREQAAKKLEEERRIRDEKDRAR